MKRLAFLLFAVLFAATCALGQQAPRSSQEPATPKPHIEFVSAVHDFGQIPLRTDASCEFEFTNTGSVPLILNQVRASCGCTVPEWPREPVLPGEKGIIKVKYTTVTRPNVINKSIIVHSNADNGQVILRIKGEVVNEG